MKMFLKRGLFFLVLFSCSLVKAEKPELVQLISSCLQLPYILTLESKNSDLVRFANIMAMLDTNAKVAMKFLDKPHNQRFGKLLMWNVPLFAGYAASAWYDLVNTFNTELMIAERQEGNVDLNALKKELFTLIAVEISLRVLVLVMDAKRQDGLVWLKTLIPVVSESANIIELYRLLSRYKTNKVMPGLNIAFHIEVEHAKALSNLVDEDDDRDHLCLQDGRSEFICEDESAAA